MFYSPNAQSQENVFNKGEQSRTTTSRATLKHCGGSKKKKKIFHILILHYYSVM